MAHRTFMMCTVALVSLGAVSCGDPEIVVPDVLTVVAVLPSHGSTQVNTDIEALIYFSHRVAADNELLTKINIECRGTPPCSAPSASGCSAGEISVAVNYDPGTKVASAVPDSMLQSDTCFTIVVSDGVESADENIGPLPVEIRSSFQTR